MTTQDDTLLVDFAPAPSYLFDYLIADIQTSECIFDLVDNSIDAARAKMRVARHRGLQEDYSGFKITLKLDSEGIVVEDNCSGMSEQNFTSVAFRTGLKSRHTYGIGHFGVGLKRAILKLGERCKVVTDDGTAQLALEFTRAELDKADDFKLPATKSKTSGVAFTSIQIGHVTPDTKRDLDAVRWRDVLKENMARRYGLFIAKGLTIEVDNSIIETFAPQPVANTYIPLQEAEFTSHGVKVKIVAGVHEKYRFGKTIKGNVGADPDNLQVHKLIAKEFGWYIVCNDRVILLHDQTYKTGWTTNWHNEYNGFVGWVYFESEDPSLLPWNTKKTDIRENSDVYADVRDKLQQFAQKYRHTTPLSTHRRKEDRQTITADRSPPRPVSGKPNSTAVPAPTPATSKSILEGSATKRQIQSLETLLPLGLPVAFQQPRLAAIVYEAERLSIADFPYASAILLRTIFDAGMRDYLRRHSHFIKMRDDVLNSKIVAGQAAPTDKERKNYSPSLSDMITWCANNGDIFPDPNARACKQACDNFKKNLKTLNGITHEEGSISNASQVRIIRDEVLQGLLHILSI
ncbi:ATP-binding protein [Asticcacaulis sp. AND118]|uniref:ATP-binding protein n=1 Tax=Asticcacaulis sp. AND118 TaxID=2840468 RepID=UPI001D000E9D|nr:ATP-binding protein [Asticcacaulis sp. AND118]UDF03278.1 ATP-binding protein [Asticcacaulis sp. AND118]